MSMHAGGREVKPIMHIIATECEIEQSTVKKLSLKWRVCSVAHDN
jgi:hypothetical protein